MLVLCRHGRTTANAAGLLLGRADPPLDELGRAQADALSGVTYVAGAARAVCSPLRRCRETAAAFGLPVTVDERWIELDYGEYDERPFATVPTEVWQRWRTDVTYTPPGGESLVELGGRVRAACDDLASEVMASDVVVVTHVSPFKAAVAWALGVGDEIAWRMQVAPASMARIAVGQHGPTLLSFGEVH